MECSISHVVRWIYLSIYYDKHLSHWSLAFLLMIMFSQVEIGSTCRIRRSTWAHAEILRERCATVRWRGCADDHRGRLVSDAQGHEERCEKFMMSPEFKGKVWRERQDGYIHTHMRRGITNKISTLFLCLLSLIRARESLRPTCFRRAMPWITGKKFMMPPEFKGKVWNERQDSYIHTHLRRGNKYTNTVSRHLFCLLSLIRARKSLRRTCFRRAKSNEERCKNYVK